MAFTKLTTASKFLPLLLVTIALNLTNTIHGQPQSKVVLIIIDYLTPNDLLDFEGPNLTCLRQIGALGLVSTRTIGRKTPESIYATIGAGNYAQGGAENRIAFNWSARYENHKAYQVFYRRIHIKAPKGAVLNLGIIKSTQRNIRCTWYAPIGNLGSSLHLAGYKTAVIGNADIPTEFRRHITIIPMDEYGIVDMGDVSTGLLELHPYSPFGLRTNINKIIAQFGKFKNRSDLTVIQFGDLARLEEYRTLITEDIYNHCKLQALSRFDMLLGKILDQINLNNTLLLILSPTPPPPKYSKRAPLGTLIMAGKTIKPELISSPTTRNLGIVTLVDITPTILDFFHIQPKYNTPGRPIYSVETKDKLSTLHQLEQRLTLKYSIRIPFIQGAVSSYVFLLLAAAIAIFLPVKIPKFWRELLRILLLTLICLPFGLLITPLFNPPTTVSYVLLVILASLFIGFVSSQSSQRILLPIFTITALTTLALILDCLLGQRLITDSLYGHCLIVGGRFYGMGNTYMGVFIGCILLVAFAGLDLFTHHTQAFKWILLILFVFTATLIGYFKFGANLGGFITAILAFGISTLKIFDKKVNWYAILYIIILLLGLLLLFALIDYLSGQASESHIGKFITSILAGDYSNLLRTMERKISTNLASLKTAAWPVFLSTYAAVLAIIIYRFRDFVSRALAKFPNIKKGLLPIAVGLISALIFNDSGIVAFGVMLSIVGMSLIYILLETKAYMDNL